MTTGAEPCEFLPWDSGFWGITIARVRGGLLTPARLDAIDAWARESAAECLYFLASGDAPGTWRLAEAAGFRLVDVRLDLRRPAGALGDAACMTRPATAADVDALVRIASTSHRITRFYSDAHFSDERCDEFYATWIRRSILEDFADEVLVIEHDGAPMGYVTCHAHSESNEGSIGLIAVDEGARGRGFGLVLTRAAVAWCQERGLIRTTVVTQGRNIAAQRMFQSCGFATATTGIWFHRWRDDA